MEYSDRFWHASKQAGKFWQGYDSYGTLQQMFATTQESGSQQSMDSQIMEMSKVSSDYMMYILATRPYMLSVATGNILFQSACARLGESIFSHKAINNNRSA